MMTEKEKTQEIIKNNWELAKSLGTFSTVLVAGSAGAAIRYFETKNIYIVILSIVGVIFGLLGILFLISTYFKNARLINKEG
jgi:hypothetical protein